MRVERSNRHPWRPEAARESRNEQRVPLCPACQSQGLELNTAAGTKYLCISCNHSWEQ